MVTLYIILIHPEIIQVDEKAVQQYHPKSRLGKIRRETTEAKFMIGFADSYNLRIPARDVRYYDINNDNSAKRFNDALHNLRPYNGFDAAGHCIKDDRYAHHYHDHPHGNTGKCLQTQGYAEKYGTHTCKLRQQKTDDSVSACPWAKALF